MKAAVVRKPNIPIVIEERLIPQPEAGEVLIKVHACGVCHSDLMVLLGYFPFATYPRVPGHEVAGVVEKVGEGVTWPKVGDRVGMPWLFSACGHCDQCVRGAEILCHRNRRYAGRRLSGVHDRPCPLRRAHSRRAGFRRCRAPDVRRTDGIQRNAPGGFSAQTKSCRHRIGRPRPPRSSLRKAMGGRVAVISNSPDKQEEAHELGAEYFVNTKAQKAGDALRDWDGGADIILATAPGSEAATDAVPGLAPDGTLVTLGVGPGNISVSPMDLVGGHRRVMGSPSGGRSDVRATLNFSAHNKVVPRITKYPLQDAGKALDLMQSGKLRDRAVLMIAYSGPP